MRLAVALDTGSVRLTQSLPLLLQLSLGVHQELYLDPAVVNEADEGQHRAGWHKNCKAIKVSILKGQSINPSVH